MSDESIVGMFEEEWGEIDALLSGLQEDDWDRATECPGWTVRDNVSHVIGIESRILGRQEPPFEVGDPPHVKNDFGRGNEVAVALRRDRDPQEVLAEYREVTAERLGVLRAMTEADFSAESWTPRGPGTVRDLMYIRLYDCWMHEQDIRRAVRRPGHLGGLVGEMCFERTRGFLPFVVGKKAAAPDGTTVAFTVTTPDASERDFAVVVDGRARLEEAVPDNPTVAFTLGFETLVRLTGGRCTPDDVRGTVKADGPDDLRERILQSMNVMF